VGHEKWKEEGREGGREKEMYLLHQPIHARLLSSLEQSRDGQGADRTIGVRQESLHIVIALGDDHGVPREGGREGGVSNGWGPLRELPYRRCIS